MEDQNNISKENGSPAGIKSHLKPYLRPRIRTGLVVTIFGFIIFVIGVKPELVGQDRSPVLGFVQIAVFLVGMALICLGGFITLNTLWNGGEKSIAADFGFRFVATGYVVCVTSGMADVFGLGNQPFPQIPYFGPWQALGVIIGELIITLGFILLIPWTNPHRPRST